MKTTVKFVSILFLSCAGAHAQVMPEASAGGANLSYSLRYSQVASFGGGIGDQQRALVTGNFDFGNGNRRLPFTVGYAGGYSWNISGPAYIAGFNQRLFVSQGIAGQKWSISALDDVSFLPAAPTTGFSGVAGSGEPASGTPSQSGETVLTVNTQSISNFGTVNFNRMISHALSFNVGGGSFFLSFPGSDGYSMNGFTANGGVTQRLGARSSLIGGYSYSRTDFTQSGFILETNGVTVGFQRHWNGKFATTASVGPQWTTSSDPTTVPSTSSYSISASASYKLRAGSISAVYRRGVSSGGGFLLGAEVDSVSANYSRNFGRAWSTGIVGSYNRTAGLSNNGVLSAKFGSAQVNRRINRNISAFLSYTAIDQSSSASVPSNVLTSLTNEISIGIGWTPLETRLRH